MDNSIAGGINRKYSGSFILTSSNVEKINNILCEYRDKKNSESKADEFKYLLKYRVIRLDDSWSIYENIMHVLDEENSENSKIVRLEMDLLRTQSEKKYQACSVTFDSTDSISARLNIHDRDNSWSKDLTSELGKMMDRIVRSSFLNSYNNKFISTSLNLFVSISFCVTLAFLFQDIQRVHQVYETYLISLGIVLLLQTSTLIYFWLDKSELVQVISRMFFISKFAFGEEEDKYLKKIRNLQGLFFALLSALAGVVFTLAVQKLGVG
jgi:hypothetical protein